MSRKKYSIQYAVPGLSKPHFMGFFQTSTVNNRGIFSFREGVYDVLILMKLFATKCLSSTLFKTIHDGKK